MIMALRQVICILCPDCVCVCQLRCEKSWRVYRVPASILQSAENVKVKIPINN